MTLRILFIHQNFPGQYVHLAPALAACGHEVHALSMNAPPSPALAGVRVHVYKIKRPPLKGQHPLLADTETKLLRAEGCAAACAALARQGFVPDVICIHPGWGEALFVREVWPQAKQLHFVEFYYAAEGRDVGFDPEFPPVDLTMRCRLAMKNLPLLQALDTMDAGVSPTHWQASAVPEGYRSRIHVIHDGIDTRRARPDAAARFKARSQAGVELDLGASDEVLSFINRNLEPNRGYHRFMRALPAILRRRPAAQVVIVGGSGVSYGAKPAAGSWQQQYLDEIRPQLSDSELARIHYVGNIPHAALMALFQVARAHVYLTVPFVLSWSTLEAMACGAVVIGSDTPPVREVITHGENGWLVDFFDAPALAARAVEALATPAGQSPLAQRARETVMAGYDLATVCLPRQMALVESMATCR